MSQPMNQTRSSRLLAAVAVLLWCVLLGARAAEPAVHAVDSVGIPVSDLARSRTFYTEVLGFKPVETHEAHGEPYEKLFGVFGVRLRTQRLKLGDEYIELMQFMAPRGRPLPPDSRSNDLWFQHVAIIVSDMQKAYALLRAHDVAHASTAPQRLPDWNPNAGGIEAFYFRDPDGNHLEILSFPRGKGLPKWQRKDSLFLGIDHTAIVVADTERSLGFYRDRLGFSIAGHSDNYGTEQEHLNNVFGAHLRITALRAASGPGVELLEYLAPAGGRPAPPDSRPIDGWYWQINLRAARLKPNTDELPFVTLPARELGFGNGYIVRDPDGHASLIEGVEP
jgi:catechol 2,3-dioxygenase-like lactoylglutathione lyase family enzyme